jgi:DNA-binding CsgD family transcriptional regulator
MDDLLPATFDTRVSRPGLSSFVPVAASLGEPEFPDSFGNALNEALPAMMFSVFRLDAEQRIRYLFAGGQLEVDRDFARVASARYAEGYWKLDPAMRAVLSDSDWNTTIRTQPWDAIPPSEYRTFCYERVRVHERMLICRRVGPEIIMIGLYRHHADRPFGKSCLNRLEAGADLLATLAWKHQRVASNMNSTDLRPDDESVARQLAGSNTQLSAREVAVCTGLLLGRSTKEIARGLGVMPSSIVTFRKRAFLKLNIATRHDLVRLYERSLSA